MTSDPKAPILESSVPAGHGSLDPVVSYCFWKYDEWQCAYDTECGECYCFENGTPRENHYRYCPGCGKRLRTTRPVANEQAQRSAPKAGVERKETNE